MGQRAARAKATYAKGDASRQQVIDAAVRQLAKRGYSNTSVSDIATAAGMSKGVVHYHFDSKDDLFEHVVAQCSRGMSDRVRGAWENEGTPIERIRAVLREMWAARTDGSPEMRVLSDLMGQAMHDAKLRRAVSNAFQTMRAEIEAEFLRAFAVIGLKPKVPAKIIPRLVHSMLDGLALHHFFDPPTPDEEREIFRAFERIAFALFEL